MGGANGAGWKDGIDRGGSIDSAGGAGYTAWLVVCLAVMQVQQLQFSVT